MDKAFTPSQKEGLKQTTSFFKEGVYSSLDKNTTLAAMNSQDYPSLLACILEGMEEILMVVENNNCNILNHQNLPFHYNSKIKLSELFHKEAYLEISSWMQLEKDRFGPKEFMLRLDNRSMNFRVNIKKFSRKDKEPAYLFIMKDLYEEKRTQQELFMSQEMSTYGQIAAEMVHEMSTPIQYIGENIEYLKKFHEKEKKLWDLVQNVIPQSKQKDLEHFQKQVKWESGMRNVPICLSQSGEGVDSLIQLMKSLKFFFYQGHNEYAHHELNASIKNIVIVTRSKWKYAAKIQLNLDDSLPLVVCNLREINQILVNLIVNAVDAISEKNKKNSEKKFGEICISTKTLKQAIHISVEDDGPGIPEDLIGKIYDPFFTTKAAIVGTGLGLSIVKKIILEHKGNIDVQSKSGKTKFTIELPLDRDSNQN